MDFIESCRKVISFDCSPQHGTSDLVDWLDVHSREKGFFPLVQSEYFNDREEKNIIIRPNKDRPLEEFLLQTHLDTTDPGPFPNWVNTQCNPFDATIREGKIYGLGVADAKLDFLCKLEALSRIGPQKVWKLQPVLVGTFGEETGMMGALKLIRKNLISTRMALIGEPTDLRLVTAGKGIATVEIRIPFEKEEQRYREEHNLKESTSTQSKIFHGRPAHSAHPELGENAIEKMLDYLLQLPSSVGLMEIDGGTSFNTVPSHAYLEVDVVSFPTQSMSQKITEIYKEIKKLDLEFKKYKDDAFNPSVPTLNIGIIRTYSDHIYLSGNCRLTPNVTQQIYEAWLQKLHEVCIRNKAMFRVSDYKKPFRTEKNTIIVKSCIDELRKMGLHNEVTTQPTSNEASLFSRVGIDCVCFGPGQREGNTHTADEHVSLNDLETSINFYEKIIRRICL